MPTLTHTRPVFLALILGISTQALAVAPDAKKTVPSQDAREALALTYKDREKLLSGMRTYLRSVQGIIEALASNKLDRVSAAARQSGNRLLGDADPALALVVPMGFTTMALDTHTKFDELASKAQRGTSRIEVLGDLSALLSNCTACHAAYKLSSPR